MKGKTPWPQLSPGLCVKNACINMFGLHERSCVRGMYMLRAKPIRPGCAVRLRPLPTCLPAENLNGTRGKMIQQRTTQSKDRVNLY